MTTTPEFSGIDTAPNDPRHVQQVIDHIAHLDDEQIAAIREELASWSLAAAVRDAQPGVWTYVFPDAVEDGRSKTITITRPEALEHREIEALMERYGATACHGVPPAVT